VPETAPVHPNSLTPVQISRDMHVHSVHEVWVTTEDAFDTLSTAILADSHLVPIRKPAHHLAQMSEPRHPNDKRGPSRSLTGYREMQGWHLVCPKSSPKHIRHWSGRVFREMARVCVLSLCRTEFMSIDMDVIQ
jgi:hypothetical protein